MMRRFGLLAALLALALGAAACDRSDKPARGMYVGASGGVSIRS